MKTTQVLSIDVQYYVNVQGWSPREDIIFFFLSDKPFHWTRTPDQDETVPPTIYFAQFKLFFFVPRFYRLFQVWGTQCACRIKIVSLQRTLSYNVYVLNTFGVYFIFRFVQSIVIVQCLNNYQLFCCWPVASKANNR